MPKKKAKTFADIRPNDLITVKIASGLDRKQKIIWGKVSGRAVMKGTFGNWVINTGGPHGTPAIATEENFVGFGDLTDKKPSAHACTEEDDEQKENQEKQ